MPLNNSSTGVKIDRGAYLSRINQMPDSQDSLEASVVFQLELRQVHVPCKLMPNGGNAMSVQKCRHYPSKVVRIAMKSNYKLIILCHEFCRGGRGAARQSWFSGSSQGVKGNRENRSMFEKNSEKKGDASASSVSLFFFHFPSRKDSWRLVSSTKVACSCWQKTRNSTSKSGEKISWMQRNWLGEVRSFGFRKGGGRNSMRVLEKCVRFLSVYDRTIPRERMRGGQRIRWREEERRKMGARRTAKTETKLGKKVETRK